MINLIKQAISHAKQTSKLLHDVDRKLIENMLNTKIITKQDKEALRTKIIYHKFVD